MTKAVAQVVEQSSSDRRIGGLIPNPFSPYAKVSLGKILNTNLPANVFVNVQILTCGFKALLVIDMTRKIAI